MKKEKLKSKFEDVCNEYVRKFVKKHGYEFFYWISNTGEIACFIEQYFFNIDDIMYDINNNCEKGLIFKWQDDCIEFEYFRNINFVSYTMGLRPSDIKSDKVDNSERGDSEEHNPLHNISSCMLSILDSLKLYDMDSLELGDETLSQMMFRKMKAYNIDLNKELGFTHLCPVEKMGE